MTLQQTPNKTNLLPETKLDVLNVPELGVEPGLRPTLLQHGNVLKHSANHLAKTTTTTKCRQLTMKLCVITHVLRKGNRLFKHSANHLAKTKTTTKCRQLTMKLCIITHVLRKGNGIFKQCKSPRKNKNNKMQTMQSPSLKMKLCVITHVRGACVCV